MAKIDCMPGLSCLISLHLNILSEERERHRRSRSFSCLIMKSTYRLYDSTSSYSVGNPNSRIPLTSDVTYRFLGTGDVRKGPFMTLMINYLRARQEEQRHDLNANNG
jgi:hypothetical protein